MRAVARVKRTPSSARANLAGAVSEPKRLERLLRSTDDAKEVSAVPSIVEDVLRMPGRPLDDDARAFFEPRFGHDFSRVRVHSDARAGESARAIRAHAYTVGQHVVFGRGRLAPRSSAGQKLLAHELAHVVQQTSGATVSRKELARQPDGARLATDAERAEIVDAAAAWLVDMADYVATQRRLAAHALATTPGAAAGARAFHQHLNQEVVERLLKKTISVFEAQRSHDPNIFFATESPQQTRLGEAYARAMEQLGLAMEEALANAPNLAPAVEATELTAYARNHLRWLESNPAAPPGAGTRTTFTQAEVDMSARRHQRVSTELGNLRATLHQYNLAGFGARRLREALLDATYRLVRDGSSRVSSERDEGLVTRIQPTLDTLMGIEWALGQAVDRLVRAETRTRAFASDPAANRAAGDTLQAHFGTRDPGYATLLADRLARMARELRGEGALTVHGPNPQDPHCGHGSVGGGLSVTVAHASVNRFHFCGNVTVGEDSAVSTVIHETVHAVIPGLGARAALTRGSETPDDRAYEWDRIYSRLSTEEALANAESYAFYVDALLGVQVSRQSAPRDQLTGCAAADEGTIRDAIARATYRIRLGAMWASQTNDQHPGGPLPEGIVDIVRVGFPGADATRAREIVTHLKYLSGTLHYYLPVVCRRPTDTEASAGALVYGPTHKATASGLSATSHAYPGGTLRICPAWLASGTALREDSLTSILCLRYRSSLPATDVEGIVRLVRHIQEEVHPSVAGRTLGQHQAADAPPARAP
jgi:hypothetical protein